MNPPPMSGSTRINIYGQSVSYRGAGIAVTIQRTFPTILMGYMTASDWIEFCQSVDKALVRMSRTRLRIWRWIGYTLAILLAGGGFMLISAIVNRSMPGQPATLAGLILVPLMYYFACWKIGASVMLNVEQKLRKVCNRESDKRLAVKFQLKQEKQYNWYGTRSTLYIECNVNEVNPSPVEAGLAGHVISDTVPITTAAVATPVFATVEPDWVPPCQVPPSQDTRTTAERMQDLDRMKAMLTEDEYNNCQENILSGDTLSSRADVVSRMEDLELRKGAMSEEEYMSAKRKILDEA